MSQTHIEDGVEYGDSYLISEKAFQILEGRMLTLVELLGLLETQSEALKSEIRQNIWGRTVVKFGQNSGNYVPAEKMPEIIQKIKEVQKIG